MSENNHRYQLVEFENKMLDPGQNRIECVSINKVEVDSNVENPNCKFGPSLETASYEETMEHLQHLTMDTEESVYTTGCDKSQKEAALTTKSFAERSKQKALPLITKLSEEKCKSETESCLSQNIKQSTKSVRPTCPEEKERANTSAEEKDVYLSNSSLANSVKLLIQDMHVKICTLQDEQLIMTKTIEEVKEKLHAVLLAVLANHKALNVEQETITPLYPFYEKNKTLPYDTYEKFQEFDRNIRYDRQQRTYLLKMLSNLVPTKIDDGEKIVELIKFILKLFITKDVVTAFNAQSVYGKCIFKDTCFCICMKSVLCNSISKERLPFFHNTFFEHLDLALHKIRTDLSE